MPDTGKLHTMIKDQQRLDQQKASHLFPDKACSHQEISSFSSAFFLNVSNFQTPVFLVSMFYCSKGLKTFLSDDFIVKALFTEQFIVIYPTVANSLFHTDSDLAYALPARAPRCKSEREWAKHAPSVWGRWLLVNLAWTPDLHHLFSAHKQSTQRTTLLISHTATTLPPSGSGNSSQLAERQLEIYCGENEITQLGN